MPALPVVRIFMRPGIKKRVHTMRLHNVKGEGHGVFC